MRWKIETKSSQHTFLLSLSQLFFVTNALQLPESFNIYCFKVVLSQLQGRTSAFFSWPRGGANFQFSRYSILLQYVSLACARRPPRTMSHPELAWSMFRWYPHSPRPTLQQLAVVVRYGPLLAVILLSASRKRSSRPSMPISSKCYRMSLRYPWNGAISSSAFAAGFLFIYGTWWHQKIFRKARTRAQGKTVSCSADWPQAGLAMMINQSVMFMPIRSIYRSYAESDQCRRNITTLNTTS